MNVTFFSEFIFHIQKLFNNNCLILQTTPSNVIYKVIYIVLFYYIIDYSVLRSIQMIFF